MTSGTIDCSKRLTRAPGAILVFCIFCVVCSISGVIHRTAVRLKGALILVRPMPAPNKEKMTTQDCHDSTSTFFADPAYADSRGFVGLKMRVSVV